MVVEMERMPCHFCAFRHDGEHSGRRRLISSVTCDSTLVVKIAINHATESHIFFSFFQTFSVDSLSAVCLCWMTLHLVKWLESYYLFACFFTSRGKSLSQNPALGFSVWQTALWAEVQPHSEKPPTLQTL